MTNDIKRGFTVSEAAAYIGRSETFIRKLKRDNRLPAYTDGDKGKVLTFFRADLDAYLDGLKEVD